MFKTPWGNFTDDLFWNKNNEKKKKYKSSLTVPIQIYNCVHHHIMTKCESFLTNNIHATILQQRSYWTNRSTVVHHQNRIIGSGDALLAIWKIDFSNILRHRDVATVLNSVTFHRQKILGIISVFSSVIRFR